MTSARLKRAVTMVSGMPIPGAGEIMTLPYVGNVLRLRAFTASEAMLACVLVIAVPFAIASSAICQTMRCLSGLRSPYPGTLGVVEKGAIADLLLVDGDPTRDLSLVSDPGKNFVVIMKDGIALKNTI